ncbi:MAG: hypothetical protein GY713_17875, partial [Actinomycetia bacterium]|nr:hypothetical protein [Actinomycetes bacterium]
TATATAADGVEVDTGFGVGGFALAGAGSDEVEGVHFGLELSDGRVAVAGTSGVHPGFVEIFDRGGDSEAFTVLPDPFWGWGLAGLFEHPDGGVVVFGRHYLDREGLLGPHMVAARLDGDLNLDPSYGVGGISEEVNTQSAFVSTWTPDGSVLVAVEGWPVAEVHRIGPDGLLDQTYGTDGAAALPAPAAYASVSVSVREMFALTDGSVIVDAVGWDGVHQRPFVPRLDPAGNPDTSFAGVGYVVPGGAATDELGQAVTLFDDGSLGVTVSRTLDGSPAQHPKPMDLIVRRFLADGSADTAFGAGGEIGPLNFDDVPDAGVVYSAQLAPSPNVSMIALIRGAEPGTAWEHRYWMARITPTGQFDTAFGADGTGLIELPVGSSPRALPLPDGSVLLANRVAHLVNGLPVYDPTTITLYTPTGSIDPEFNGGTPVQIDGQPTRLSQSTTAVLVPIAGASIEGAPTDGGVLRIQTQDPPPPDVGGETVCGTDGYWLGEADGDIYPFGDATHHGQPTPAPATTQTIAATPTGCGYWTLNTAGHITNHGDAPNLGQANLSQLEPDETATSLGVTPTGQGLWIFTTRGRVLTLGDAQPAHSGNLTDLTTVNLAGPILDAKPTPTGNGYYMLGSGAGVFAF